MEFLIDVFRPSDLKEDSDSDEEKELDNTDKKYNSLINITCCPLFWDAYKCCQFLVECYDHIKENLNAAEFKVRLDFNAIKAGVWSPGQTWKDELGSYFELMITRFTIDKKLNKSKKAGRSKVNTTSFYDLLGVIRNKFAHKLALDPSKMELTGWFDNDNDTYKFNVDKFVHFWVSHFPKLLPFVWINFHKYSEDLRGYYPGDRDQIIVNPDVWEPTIKFLTFTLLTSLFDNYGIRYYFDTRYYRFPMVTFVYLPNSNVQNILGCNDVMIIQIFENKVACGGISHKEEDVFETWEMDWMSSFLENVQHIRIFVRQNYEPFTQKFIFENKDLIRSQSIEVFVIQTCLSHEYDAGICENQNIYQNCGNIISDKTWKSAVAEAFESNTIVRIKRKTHDYLLLTSKWFWYGLLCVFLYVNSHWEQYNIYKYFCAAVGLAFKVIFYILDFIIRKVGWKIIIYLVKCDFETRLADFITDVCVSSQKFESICLEVLCVLRSILGGFFLFLIGWGACKFAVTVVAYVLFHYVHWINVSVTAVPY